MASGTGPIEPRDRMESLLAEWREADRAGVFARTIVDALSAMSGQPGGEPAPSLHDDSVPVLWFYRRWALAAAVVLSVGAGTLFLSMELRTIRERQAYFAAEERDRETTVVESTAPAGPDARPRVGCLTGPALARAGDCDGVDFDGDGDVDLADIGRLQLSLSHPHRALTP